MAKHAQASTMSPVTEDKLQQDVQRFYTLKNAIAAYDLFAGTSEELIDSATKLRSIADRFVAALSDVIQNEQASMAGLVTA